MTDNTSFLTIILYVMLAIMFALAVALIFIYLNMKVKEKQKEKEDSAVAESKPVKNLHQKLLMLVQFSTSWNSIKLKIT